MITAEEFWNRIDERRTGRPWNKIASRLNLKYNSIISMRKNGQYPSFFYAVTICNFLEVRLDYILGVETKGLEFRRPYHRGNEDKYFGRLFWLLADDYRGRNAMTWAYVSDMINVPKTTISSAKNANRTLPLDVTIEMMQVLSMPLQDCVEYLSTESEIGSEAVRIEKSELDALRDEIIASVKGMDDKNRLQELRRYILFLKSQQ